MVLQCRSLLTKKMQHWLLYWQNHLEKLIQLGLVKLDAEWTVRLMGQTAPMFGGESPDDATSESVGLPFAFVMERAGTKLQFVPDLRESVLPPLEPGSANPNLVLAK